MRYSRYLSFLVALLFVAGGIVANPVFASAQSSGSSRAIQPSFNLSTAGPSLPAVLKGPGFVSDYALLPKTDQQIENMFSYSPSEIHQVYNSSGLLNEGITGKGVTIAIVDPYGDPTIASDLQQFDATFGLPNPPSFNVLCIDGPCNYTLGIATGASVEIELDVEWAHAMAPGANINLYISSNFLSGPLFDAELAAVLGASGTAENVAGGIGTPGVYHNNIISNSWGEPENDFQTSQSLTLNYDPTGGNGPLGYPWLDQVFQEAADRNITVFASTGDAADYLQGYPYLQTLPYGGTEYPSTDPFVTAVGGTSLYMKTDSGSISYPEANAKGSYGYETAWSWFNGQATAPNYAGGGTGGLSTFFPQPLYQQGLGDSTNGSRAVPDVSWDADPQTGVLVYGLSPYTGEMSFYGIGGTSVGTPDWAGVQALLDQYAGRSLGFMNPTLYSILSSPAEYAKAFHDITFGNQDPLSAAPGWDPTTGMGTPNIGELASIVAGKAAPLSVRVTDDLTRAVSPTSPTPAFSFGDTLTLSASVNDHTKVSGPVTADIASIAGGVIASNIPMIWNSSTRTYVATYQIKPSNLPGQWVADVKASNGMSSGVGYNSFAVGGSSYVFSPIPIINSGVSFSNFYVVGDTVQLAIDVENPANTMFVIGGGGAHYTASFYLNNVNGKLEGTVDLHYNSTAALWEGNFKIPRTADQGAWVVVFTGVDKHGNRAAVAYSWINVGLFIYPYTDSTTCVLGDQMTIYATTGVATGSFKAIISSDGVTLGTIHMSLLNATETLWSGTFKIHPKDPTGFYTITVSGDDHMGDRGTMSETVRVAPYTMNLNLKLSASTVALSGGKETVSVKIVNGNGQLLTVGTVQAYISLTLANGTVISPLSVPGIQGGLPLTYNDATHSFMGVFTTSGSPAWLRGEYSVGIIAFDPIGDYGTAMGAFTVR